MKEDRAKQIAQELSNHSKWKSHGRSLKINDIERIGLRVSKIDDNPHLSELVYRIQTVCSLLFNMSTIFKIFATEHCKIFRQATPQSLPLSPLPFPNNSPSQKVKFVQFNQKCPKCGIIHKMYGKLEKDMEIDKYHKQQGIQPFPSSLKLTCSCGYVIDMSPMRNDIELKIKRKLIID